MSDTANAAEAAVMPMTSEDPDDLRLEIVSLRKKRTQWTIDQPAGQDFLFGRSAFPLEVTTGNFPCGIGLFLIINSER
jgi:hypothetical protein